MGGVSPDAKKMGRVLVLALVVNAAFWGAWLVDHSWILGDTSEPYVIYENSFLLAQALSMVAVLLGYVALRRGRMASAALWIPTAAGSKGYVVAVDVLHNTVHGVYAAGAYYAVLWGGLNVLTLGFTVLAMRWTWTERRTLERRLQASRAEVGGEPDGDGTARSAASSSPTARQA